MCRKTLVLVGVTGFVDTLPLFKLAYPGRTSYRQESLVQDLIMTQYNAQNASADLAALHQLYDAMPQEYCSRFRKSRLRNQKQILPRFDVLITGRIHVMNTTQAESVAVEVLLQVTCVRSLRGQERTASCVY